jgi:hypothetical protein
MAALLTRSLTILPDSPTLVFIKSAAESPYYIKWNPIIFGNDSVRTVFPVPGGPYKTNPLENLNVFPYGSKANWLK